MSLIPKIGDNFSGCQILARCGNGAFGITFLAQNPLGHKVIIKIISSPRILRVAEMLGITRHWEKFLENRIRERLQICVSRCDLVILRDQPSLITAHFRGISCRHFRSGLCNCLL